jgi:hypothetical protein
VFDIIASEYGYTLEQFGQMTVREVFVCMSNISKRKNNDLVIQAKLHGMKLEDNTKKKMVISKDDDEMLTKHLERINRERFGK